MEEIKLGSFSDFEANYEKKYKKRKEPRHYFYNYLFRGQSNSEWELQTTLERHLSDQGYKDKEVSWLSYLDLLRALSVKVSSLTDRNFDIPNIYTSEGFKDFYMPPALELMAYARHHGFPSPFLDWSMSPYVAAFFAYRGAKTGENISIYAFLESDNQTKGYSVLEPSITGVGSYLKTHSRHHAQQCEYTFCSRLNDSGIKYYCPFMNGNFSESQNKLTKFILPGSEKFDVLDKLNFMNINSYSLFGNEEGIMDWVAIKDLKRIFLT